MSSPYPWKLYHCLMERPRIGDHLHILHEFQDFWLIRCAPDTIITSFPKRYGRNKPDPSTVHKSIRMRLQVCRKGEIRSAYDLALIIIDQCSRVFFDRTKTADRQPQVMDLFAGAIGNVVCATTNPPCRHPLTFIDQ